MKILPSEQARAEARSIPTVLPQPGPEALDLTAVLHALSDPVRLEIVRKLADTDGEIACGSFNLRVAKSTCTHHFTILREAGIISQRDEGTRRYNRLRRDALDARWPGLLDAVLAAVQGRARSE
jgi:DNA-binding transcriptional ArsR family regulator